MAWILGLTAGALGIGTIAYVLTRPKTTAGGGGTSTGGGGATLPQGPTTSHANAGPGPSPYGQAQGAQPNYGAYQAQNSMLLNPTTGNA
jgi:hypothetical protein